MDKKEFVKSCILNVLARHQGLSKKELMKEETIINALLMGYPVVKCISELIEQKAITRICIYPTGLARVFERELLFAGRVEVRGI